MKFARVDRDADPTGCLLSEELRIGVTEVRRAQGPEASTLHTHIHTHIHIYMNENVDKVARIISADALN